MLKLASLLLTGLLAAQNIAVRAGAVDDQVFQRNDQGRADVKLSGAADASAKSIEARVTRKHLPVAGFDWREIGKVSGGAWSGLIAGLPTGGPYRIELRASASGPTSVGPITAINNILVGDLWLLAGQSNMEGVGDLKDVEPPHEMVHTFDQTDHWMIAEEPLHRLVDAADRVHWRLDAQRQPNKLEGERLAEYIANRKKGAGLGLPFAVEMVRRTGVPIGLLPCAHGGTSMDQWDPAQKDKSGDSLYGATLRRFRATGGRIKGILWYQGESDASPQAVAAFQGKFERLVAAFREDFHQPELPFYYVQIGRHVSLGNQNEWNAVQDAQRLTELTLPKSGMAAAVDLSLDDGIHVSTQDHKRLGRRLANVATGDTKRGPRPVSAAFADGRIAVTFSDVNGRLRAPGKISGFSVHGAQGEYLPLIYKQIVDATDGNMILLYIGGRLPADAVLHYGKGRDPYCNVTDSVDMALPAFGPMQIQR